METKRFGRRRRFSRVPPASVPVDIEGPDDLFLVRADAEDIHDAWRVAPWVLPWLYTLCIEPDRIVLAIDRSRGIRLARTGSASAI